MTTAELTNPTRSRADSRVNASLVVRADSSCAYTCAYRLISARCVLLQFVAAKLRPICSTFQLLAVRCSLCGRTFNPKVAGSIPARPIRKCLHTGNLCARCGVRSANEGQQPGDDGCDNKRKTDP